MKTSPDPAVLPIELEEHLLRWCRDPLPGLGIRRLASSPVDVRLFFPSTGTLEGAAGQELLARLEGDPAVESARRKGNSVSLRMTEDYIESLGAYVERGLDLEAHLPGDLSGRSYVVNFLNPNATKPLHIGHLRNVSIGMALAAFLESCGAHVVRQCYVCDIGRSVAEAMAGYERFHSGADPEASGERPDQFVGRCYAEYVSTLAGPGDDDTTAAGDPADAEGFLRGDRADELIRGWAAGDPAVRALWERIRGWALDGQARTLARLGGRWDRVHHESDSLETVQSFVQRGLAEGLFARGAGGAIVYETGRSEYALLKLLREDGFPTEHARVIGLFLGEQASTIEADAWIVVCGDEWGKAGELELEVAGRLAGRELVEKVEVLAHGMVTVAGSKMKSRDGQAILIDDFLDGLAGSSEVQGILDESGRTVSAETLVDLLVKGYFLSRKPSKGLEFRWEPFTDERSNPAWTVARAWCRAQHPGGGAFDTERYRTAAMQVFQYRQLLARSPDGFQGTTLMKFASGLAAWYLSAPSDERLDRVVRSLLCACLRTLGISTAGRVDG